MSYASDHKQMLLMVASALTHELLNQVAFVGGCTTGLLITDDYSREQVRHTQDVDLIVHLVGYVGWALLQQKLRALGFSQSLEKGDPVCAMRLGELRVDFMPDDEAILGFSNRWYSDALNSSIDYSLNAETTIKLVSPVFFVATKLEAWLGRGNNDPLRSHDVEDLLNLFDGRRELITEIEQETPALRQYIANEIGRLLMHRDFDYAVQSCAQGDSEREALIFQRLEQVIEGAD
jgi:predicted nucleotidyltransferase